MPFSSVETVTFVGLEAKPVEILTEVTNRGCRGARFVIHEQSELSGSPTTRSSL